METCGRRSSIQSISEKQRLTDFEPSMEIELSSQGEDSKRSPQNEGDVDKPMSVTQAQQCRDHLHFEFWSNAVIDIGLALLSLLFGLIGLLALAGNGKTVQERRWLPQLIAAMKYASLFQP